MAILKFPLSGDVSQLISPWTSWFSSFGSQIGLVNVHLGKSSAPDVEREILNEVGSYGKQLGRIGDGLIVLLRHFDPKQPLTEKERKAIVALELMLDEVAGVKEEHGRNAMRLNDREERAGSIARSSTRTSRKQA